MFLDIPKDENKAILAILSFGRKKYFPSLRTLANALKWSHTKVSYVVNKLFKKNLIKISFGFWSEHHEFRRSNTYEFNWTELVKCLSKKGKKIYYEGNCVLHNKILILNYKLNKYKEVIHEQRIFTSNDDEITFLIKKRRKNRIRDELIKQFGIEKTKDAISYVIHKCQNYLNPWVYLSKNLEIFQLSEGFNERLRQIKKVVFKNNNTKIERMFLTQREIDEQNRVMLERLRIKQEEDRKKNEEIAKPLRSMIEFLKSKGGIEKTSESNTKIDKKGRNITKRTNTLSRIFQF